MSEKNAKKPYISVPFDLDCTSKKEKVKGRADFYPDRIEIYEGDEKRTVKTEGIKRYKCSGDKNEKTVMIFRKP